MKNLVARRRVAALSVAPVAVVASAPAYAQTTGATTPDFTALTDAVVAGLGSGMGVMMTFAPSLIMFAITWMLVRRASSAAKAG